MASPVNIRFNRREFDATLRRYVLINKREIADIINTKAFFIARRAVLETPKAEKNIIRSSLGRIVRSKTGARVYVKKVGETMWGAGAGTQLEEKQYDAFQFAPLAAIIINARRGRAGKPGLYGKAMRDSIMMLIAARNRSIAFIKSGWLPAIKRLEPFVSSKRGAPRSDRSPKIFGKEKGRAIPARPGWKVQAAIENSASTDRDKKGALIKYGEPALARAFAAETRSMLKYMEDKLAAAARRTGIRTN